MHIKAVNRDGGDMRYSRTETWEHPTKDGISVASLCGLSGWAGRGIVSGERVL